MSNENDPQAIREQIEATRERISDTAEALAYKTDVPARVKDKLSDQVEGVKSAARDAASAVGSKLSGASATAKSATQDLAESAKSTLSDASESTKSALAGAAESARSAVSGAAEGTRSAVAGVSDAAQQGMSARQTRAADLTARTRDAVGSPSGDQTNGFTAQAKDFITNNPLPLALASVAVGFVVGLVLPVSDVERENVGPISDRVTSEAKARASDLAQQGKAAVAQAVSDTLNPPKE